MNLNSLEKLIGAISLKPNIILAVDLMKLTAKNKESLLTIDTIFQDGLNYNQKNAIKFIKMCNHSKLLDIISNLDLK